MPRRSRNEFAREVDFVEDIDQLGATGNPKGPSVIFRALAFAYPNTQDYLYNLEMNHWWARHDLLHRHKIWASPTRCDYEMAAQISGWQKDDNKSWDTRMSLHDLARPFFPKLNDGDGLENLLNDISRPIARFAAITDQRALLVVLRAEMGGRRTPDAPVFSLLPGPETAMEMTLLGPGRLFADSKYYVPDTIERALASELTSADHDDLRLHSTQAPTNALAAWRGKGSAKPVLSARPSLKYEQFRLSVMALPLPGVRLPAHTQKPGLLQTSRDYLKTRVLRRGPKAE